MNTIHLGYEVGSGREIQIPIRHLAVTGQTQESGKTTTLEALICRSGLRAIAFVTKRGEGSFANGRRIQPYFRDRADWQFVDQLLEAQLREKNKFLRPWIIRICRTTKMLADVQREVRRALEKAKGINEGVYTQLDAYLELIVPEIARARLADRIDLSPGLNVMDLAPYSTPMQMLFVQSAIDWVNAHEDGVITIIPEAWEFIPEGKGSPVKASAVALVRKGGGLKNYIWVDSQDMAGVDKVILRGCAVWLIGVQREANEIKRNLANIPADIKRPQPAAVATLERGQFFVCFAKETIKSYVQPAWMEAIEAREIAQGKRFLTVEPPRREERKENTVTETEAQKLRQENDFQKEEIARLKTELTALRQAQGGEQSRTMLRAKKDPPLPKPGPYWTGASSSPASLWSLPIPPGENGLDEAAYQELKRRLLSDLEKNPTVLRILTQRPELMVETERKMVMIDGSSLKGRLARLLATGFFDEGKTQSGTRSELKRTGPDVNQGNLWKMMNELLRDGFLTCEGGNTYKAVPDMKVNVVEK